MKTFTAEELLEILLQHKKYLLGDAGVYANLRGANLSGVCYNENTAFFAISCPEEGNFIGWKKCKNSVIVKLMITGKRSSATSRKCRTSEAVVMEICNGALEAVSSYRESFIYRSGEVVSVPDFDENRWNDCSSGIHFFITRAEAENY